MTNIKADQTKMDVDRAIWKLYKNLPSVFVDALDPQNVQKLLQDFCSNTVVDYSSRFSQIVQNRKKLADLKAVPQVAQRSPEWYALRQTMLTASDTAQAMGMGKFGTRADLLKKKMNERQGIVAPFKTLPPMKWGIMFEPMALRCYQAANDGITVHEFGLIPHNSLPYGASPDGITDLGIMIEIKCPFRRKINGDILEQYAIQMQGQMAVCGLSECDFIECDMECFSTEEDYIAEVKVMQAKPAEFGVIAEFNTGYIYSEAMDTPEETLAWIKKDVMARLKADETVNLLKLHYWKLRKMLVQRVRFDEQYFKYTIEPAIIQFWQDCEPIAESK